MVWTDTVQGAARCSGWLPEQAPQRGNVPSRPSSLRVRARIDAASVALLANMHCYLTRRAPCQPRFWLERAPSYSGNEF